MALALSQTCNVQIEESQRWFFFDFGTLKIPPFDCHMHSARLKFLAGAPQPKVHSNSNLSMLHVVPWIHSPTALHNSIGPLQTERLPECTSPRQPGIHLESNH